MHGSENQPVVPPKTFSAAHRLEQKQRKNKPFAQGTASRAESNCAATIAAMVWQSQRPIGGVIHTCTSEKKDDEGTENSLALSYTRKNQLKPLFDNRQ